MAMNEKGMLVPVHYQLQNMEFIIDIKTDKERKIISIPVKYYMEPQELKTENM